MSSPETNQPTDSRFRLLAGTDRAQKRLVDYFLAMIESGASDLHLKTGSAPYIRITTEIRPTGAKRLSAAAVEEMAVELMTDRERALFQEHGNVDLAYELEGSDRFRINIFRQRGAVSIAVRRVTRNIPDFKSLHLPPAVEQIANNHEGLILVSGPTGGGKSTTIAAMLEHINTTRPCHIVTIENPIEYIYDDKKSLIDQREIGIDVADFQTALKHLPRADPDVVLIGELRDHETFEAALQVSETGHLVFGTVHAAGAAQTVGRVLDLFSADSRGRVRQSLAFNLRAIICQMLLPSIVKGIDRVPAVEILTTSPTVRQLLVEARDGELPDVIRSPERELMQSFTASLFELIQQDYVDPRTAYEAAPNAEELRMLMKGISASRTGLLGR